MFSVNTISDKKRNADPELFKSDRKTKRSSSKHLNLDFDDEFDLSNDLKGLMSALQQIKAKAQMDGQKKNEETISSVAADIKSKIDEIKSKFEKERQNFAKALSKSSKEFESSLKNETAKFRSLYQKLSNEKATHLQALKDIISKYEEDKEKSIKRYEQMRKKEKTVISEHEKACYDKISQLEDSLKKKTQGDKTFSILRKTLGSFLDNASDEDFPPDD